ncbi:MAG: hypothetical protein CVU71_08985 [Deltaproteobacteria bacterium HGW-Deltaproteobacteria-6]|jgi:methyl-accepting chemotaxis protein|nr:MAG: hypothetical protein CVU71_08985 [Deltaproteobacteria bacterium HGW-Deltaproteobacteria-6]
MKVIHGLIDGEGQPMKDKVVQRNAANAEESASASQEMNNQAKHMKEFVGELAAMVVNSET